MIKNKYIGFFIVIIVLFVIYAFGSRELGFYVPKGWPEPVYQFDNNPLDDKKIQLGRHLFYDPILSRDSSVSCVNCHLQFTAFTHVDHDLSHGIENRIGIRNSQALMNLAWNTSFMWDGAVNHLDMQALAPISHPDEMDSNINQVIEKLNKTKRYPERFKAAFGDAEITGERFLKSMSQFLLTLVSSNSKYDKVMRKEKEISFTEQEEQGYQIFQTHCSTCHQEPLFTNHEFMNNGLEVDTSLNDFGRMGITKSSEDSLKFRVPSLRNIEFSQPYMHDGRFRKLRDAINHYTDDIQESPTLAEPLRANISLTSNEKVDLLAFLLTLSDKEFLFNPEHSFPRD